MNYRTITTITFILLIFRSLSGQGDTETRSYIKTVPLNKESSLEVINKYGNIHITQWDKDSAYIRAEIKAFAPNQTKLKRMFEGISINFTDTKYLVRAQTDFTQNINMLFESFKGMTSKLISYDSRVEINYYISIPIYLNIEVENKYGDVYMEDNTGNLRLTMSNGSFKANSIGKATYINLSFCDATINSVSSGNIDGSFSEISIGEAKDLSVKSVSSRFDIRKAGSIQLESRRDKYFIGNVDKLAGTSYFSDYKITNLIKGINVTTRYGSLDADMIEKGFNEITINSGYTDISLGFEQGSSYKFDIRHINSFLVLPDNNIKTEKKTLNEEKKEYMTFGTVGNNPGSAKVDIDANRGNIYLK